MGQDPGITILIALIGAGASILVAWITTRGKDGGAAGISDSGSAGRSPSELKGTVSRLLTAGVLYAVGALFMFGGVFSYIQIQSYTYRSIHTSFLYIAIAEFFMGLWAVGAAIFIHLRAKKVVFEYPNRTNF